MIPNTPPLVNQEKFNIPCVLCIGQGGNNHNCVSHPNYLRNLIEIILPETDASYEGEFDHGETK